jgi:methylmalonyl-CoA/ethylmalonyl-CoA epimerase
MAELAGIDAVFDHAALAAHRIRDLTPIYQDLLGGRFYQGGDNARVGYRAAQLTFRGGGKVELMEPLAGSTFLDSFLRRHPTGGLHHLTFTVRSLPDALHRLRERGFRVHGESDADPIWHEVFLHPRDAFGTLVQIAEPRAGYGPATGFDLDGLLSGHGNNGTGVPSS